MSKFIRLLRIQSVSIWPHLKTLVVVCLLWFPPLSVHAKPEIHGHVKTQYLGSYFDLPSAQLAGTDRDTLSQAIANIRFTSRYEWDSRWSTEAHVESLSQATEPSNRSFIDGGFTPRLDLLSDARTLFDLSLEITDTAHGFSIVRADRLWTRYATSSTNITLGRQALSWENGLFFNPADFANPFLPLAVDKEYKTGQDMLAAEVALSQGTTLELAAIPRRPFASAPGAFTQNNQRESVTWAASTLALRARQSIPDYALDIEAIIGHHEDELISTLGFSTQLLEAVVRSDVVVTHQDDGDLITQAVLNADRSFVWFDRNVYFTFEYFYSGYGVSRQNYLEPTTDLQNKIQRGELFTLGRHYLGQATQIELSPLVNLTLSALVNIQDQSALLQPRIVFSLTNNWDLLLGALTPVGSRGDEFLAIPLPTAQAQNGRNETTTRFLTPGHQILVKLSYYF